MRIQFILLFAFAATMPNAANQLLAQDIRGDQWSPEERDALKNAEGVWHYGTHFFDEHKDAVSWLALGGDADEPTAFAGIDIRTGHMLLEPDVRDVVQFGCCLKGGPYEESLERALRKGTPKLKLQALVVLTRVRAPSSVPLQRRALNELLQLKAQATWQPLLRELANCFEPGQLLSQVNQERPEERYSNSERTYYWSIRALGVIRHKAALPRLVELSRSDSLFTSLAAERSIEDFSGDAAEQALVKCLLGWQYDAYEHAASALLKRNKPLLRDTLLAATPPRKCRYQKALFLARCDEPASVPLLCAEVRSYQLVDIEMFDHIARLGLHDHRELIERLPDLVRDDQRSLAKSTIKKYLKKIQAQD